MRMTEAALRRPSLLATREPGSVLDGAWDRLGLLRAVHTAKSW